MAHQPLQVFFHLPPLTINMNFEEVRRYSASSIDVIVQLGRADGRRGISQVYLPDQTYPAVSVG